MKEYANSIIDASKYLIKKNLNRGASGNISIRNPKVPNFLLITPSGIDTQKLNVNDLVSIDLNGNLHSKDNKNKLKPSSEWRFHCDIYRKKKDINAIVHTHSTYATAVAAVGKNLPAFNYMIAVAGGNNIRCAKYAIFGSKKLSDNAIKSLKDRKACLLANHGLITIGINLTEAIYLAEEIEELCKQYIVSQVIGKPNILSRSQMNQVIKKFKDYRRDEN